MTRYAEKILFVDGEPRAGPELLRMLRGRFAMETVSGPAEALNALAARDDIAVIVAGAQMPDRSGPELLAKVRARWPQIRRIILTGSAGRDAAAAINDGKVFRALCEPIDAGLLAETLESAIEEYRFASGGKGHFEQLSVAVAAVEQSRKTFLAMMNHELRTPLNHILGFSALLEQRCKQRGETDSLEYIAYIRESGLALLRILTRIMEIVRLTAGDVQTGTAIVDVVRILHEEIKHHRPLAAQRNITIGFDAPAEALCVQADEHELGQAFAELLDNAIKFNRPGGHVSIAVNWAGEDLAIRIADTGIGMAEADVARVLGAFCQREDGLNRRFEGIGVGLTLAALTVQAHGGTLAVDSRKDHGTAVVMRLKRVIGARQTAKSA